MPDYSSDLTPEAEAQLRKEIAEFDQAATLKELEIAGEGAPDQTHAYEQWRDGLAGVFNANIENPENLSESLRRAEPDSLSEDDAIKFEKPTFSKQIVLASLEVKELLSFREGQVWQLVMRNGLSVKEAAEKLRIGERTVEEYVSRAKAKIAKHFENE